MLGKGRCMGAFRSAEGRLIGIVYCSAGTHAGWGLGGRRGEEVVAVGFCC